MKRWILTAITLMCLILLLVVACVPDQAEMSRAQFHELLAGVQPFDTELGLDVGELGAPVVYDFNNNVVDMAWVWATFGDVTWTRTEPFPDAAYVFRLVALRGKCGPASLIVRIIDEVGNPIERYAVIRYWPGSPELPDFSDSTARQWTKHGIVGKTNAQGDVGFGMGSGDYYWPAESTGASSVYVADFDGPGDFLEGLGMLAGTDHCSLNSTFQRVPKDVTPPDPPTPTPEPPGPGPTPIPGGGWDIHFEIDGGITPKD